MRLPVSACCFAASLLLGACASDHPWHPGAFHPVAPHVIAGSAYGDWMPEPGYAWDDPSDKAEGAEVHWAPGTPHPFHPHAVAGPQPGQWLPAQGFEWVNNGPDIWAVRPAR